MPGGGRGWRRNRDRQRAGWSGNRASAVRRQGSAEGEDHQRRSQNNQLPIRLKPAMPNRRIGHRLSRVFGGFRFPGDEPWNVAARRQFDHHAVVGTFRRVVLGQPLPEPVGLYPDNRIFLVVELSASFEDFQGNRGFLDFVLPPQQNHIAQILQQLDTPRRLRKEAGMPNRLNFIPNFRDGGGMRNSRRFGPPAVERVGVSVDVLLGGRTKSRKLRLPCEVFERTSSTTRKNNGWERLANTNRRFPRPPW